MIQAKHHIFICAGSKLSGDKKGMCHTRGSSDLARRFLEELDDRELTGDVLLSTTSCFGICDKGPIVVVYPEGVWYCHVQLSDVETIVDEHIEGGKPVTALMI
jgi:(2Fe-2S) ferredoxin